MTERERTELASDAPYVLVERGDAVVVRFGESVDHRREPWEKQLAGVVSRKLTVVWDLRQTEDIDSGWLRLLGALHDTGKRQGKRVFTLGMRPEIQASADVLGRKGRFEHIAKLTEAGLLEEP